MKKQSRTILIFLILIVLAFTIGYFITQQTAIGIPEGSYPQQLVNLNEIKEPSNTNCFITSDKTIRCECPSAYYGGSYGLWEGYSPITYSNNQNIITTTIPPNVNLFEKVINNFNVNFNSKQEVQVHIMAWLHRKNTDLYFDLSKDANLKAGDNTIQFTIPENELYITADPYEVVIIPTQIQPVITKKDGQTTQGQVCNNQGKAI